MEKRSIEKFKKVLVDVKKKIEENIDGLNETTFKPGSNLSHYPDDPSYIANDEYEKPMAFNIMNVDQSILEQVNDALLKIENNTYGTCEKCGKKISRKRLEAKPWARYCVKCREELEKSGQVQ
ncbi:TraR/DksA family transcriptional regulator [bacterium]|nr:TraR/DksA family transcriptional regulator [bacterium]